MKYNDKQNDHCFVFKSKEKIEKKEKKYNTLSLIFSFCYQYPEIQYLFD